MLKALDVGRVWRATEGLAYCMGDINESIISTEAAALNGAKKSLWSPRCCQNKIYKFTEWSYAFMCGLHPHRP